MKLINNIKQWFFERDLKKRQFKALASGVEPRRKKRKYEKKELCECGFPQSNPPHEHSMAKVGE